MEFLVILTLGLPQRDGMKHMTVRGRVTPLPGGTRADLYAWALSQFPAELQDGTNVTFFYAEPNALEVSV